MRPLEQHLLAGQVDGPQRVVGAAEGDQFAIGRPAGAVERVVRHRVRQLQLPRRHLPDLHLAEAARRAAGRRQQLPVGRELQRLDALRQADQPGQQRRAVRLVEQHLMIARHRQQRPVR